MSDGQKRPEDFPEEELLSDEELNALLGESLELTEAVFGSQAVLLVSRRDRDLDVFTEALASRQIAHSVARNPFTALDYLRAKDYCGVIADYSLWESESSLLFRRIRELDRPVQVVFICEPGTDEAAAARQSPALTAVERPLDVGRAVEVVERLCHDAAIASVRETQDRPEAVPEAGFPEAVSPIPIASASGSEAGADGPWHRFFFKVRRALRGLEDFDARRRLVLDQLLRAQRGGAVALLDLDDGQDDPSDVSFLDARIAHAAAPGSSAQAGESREELVGKLFLGLARARRSIFREAEPDADLASFQGGEKGDQTSGVLLVSWSSGAGRRLLLSVFPRDAGDARPSTEIVEELSHLLREFA